MDLWHNGEPQSKALPQNTSFPFIALCLNINPIGSCLKHKQVSPCSAEHKADYTKWFSPVKEQSTGLRMMLDSRNTIDLWSM